MRRLRGRAGTDRQLPPAAGAAEPERELWSALVLAPVLTAAAFLGGLAFTRGGCDPGPAIVRMGLPALAAAVAAFALARAWRTWRSEDAQPRFAPGAAFERARFLRLAAVAAAASSFVVALFILAVAVVLEPCWYRA